jgi:hypothetical protein
MRNWAAIFRSVSRPEAEIVRGLLKANGIPSVLVDSRSSAYPHLGECEVHVVRNDVVRALYLVRKHENQ